MCTRIFWSANKIAKVASRTMDWVVSDEPRMWSLPAGLHRDGGVAGAIEWESRYPSLVLSMFESGTIDGMNDQGLGMHLLYLEGAGFGSPDERDVVGNTHWGQWVLDSFATVAEAIEAMSGMRVTSVPVRGQDLNCHLSIEDVQGDSAIVEPVDGRLVIHHGPQFTVMANDPTFDEQLENLTHYRPFGGDRPLPGGILSVDRFVRATYFLEHLPPPSDLAEAVAGVVHLAGNVACPPGAPYDDFSVYPTWWTSVVDLTNLTYYFWSRRSPSLVWASFGDVDPPGGQAMVLDPEAPGLVGDISDRFAPVGGPLPY
jgi:penicillin V acylase-like amidase (Ntn superfamily)